MNLVEKMKDMDQVELRQLAATQGVKVHWKAKPDTIRQAIIDHVSQPVKAEVMKDMKHPAEKPEKPVFHNTPEEVEAMLAPIKAKVPQFESSYDTDANTWYFRCKGTEECGNLDIPMRVIAMKARTISRGRLMLMGMNDHFDKTAATGKSAYTNTVLAG